VEHSIAIQIIVVLALATLLVAVFQRTGLSPILGYIVTGVVVGPYALAWLPDDTTTHTLAEVGIVLLMFTIGLEFSLPRLFASKRLVLGLGGSQVLVTTLIFALISWWIFSLLPAEAFIFGCALAMSSTAIVLKQLGEQMELLTQHGRIATGVLLFQDLISVPILVILSVLVTDPVQMGSALALSMGKATLVFVGLVFIGRHILPPLLHWIAASRSLELFMLTALVLALTAAAISAAADLPPTLGAFMAGMLLGDSEFRHQIEADIRPFRDLMLGLFFATIGMQLNPATFIEEPVLVIFILLVLVLGKTIIFIPIVKLSGQTISDALRAAISLAQGGEFGLLIISTALTLGLMDHQIAQPLFAGLILSMVLAPFLLRFNHQFMVWLTHHSCMSNVDDTETRIAETSSDYNQHVIVCGYGRLGQNLVQILSSEGISVLALDLDPEKIKQAASAGEPVLYGNITQPGVLRAAGLERAAALAITIDDVDLAEHVIRHVRSSGIEVPILVRSARGRDDEILANAGATVFPEGLETSLAFAGQLLIMLNIPPSQVEMSLNVIRANDYAPLRYFFHNTNESESDEQDYPDQIRAVIVTEGHYAVGRTPEELFSGTEIELIDVRRGAIRVPGELLDTRLRVGDVLLIKGNHKILAEKLGYLEKGF